MLLINVKESYVSVLTHKYSYASHGDSLMIRRAPRGTCL